MIPHPFHPAVVHFPIVLMLFLPVLVAVVIWRLHDGAPRRLWGYVVLTASLLVVSGMVAKEAGENEADRVERVLASDQPLEAHEDAADMFIVGAWVVLGLSLIGLAGGLTGKSARLTTLAASAVLVWLGWRVGDRGGKLVYEYGAANAYVQSVPGVAATPETPTEEHDEDR